MSRPIACLAAVLMLLAGPVYAYAADAPAPGDSAATADQSKIDAFYDGLLATMKQGPDLGFSGRAAKLEPLVERTFSLDFMVRLIVGAAWRPLDDAKKSAVLSAFTDWVVANYASQFTSYDGEKFTTDAVTDGGKGTLVVQTKIVPNGGSAVSLGYRMLNGKVIDVYLDGSISQLALWRAQFASVIRKDGIDGLIDRLTQQTKKMAAS